MSNETTEIEFPDGLIVKAPRDGAPDFVKASISIKREALITWLQVRDGEWINLQVKEAKSGKWYAAVDNWKPKEGGQSEAGNRPKQPAQDTGFSDDEIPF
jgi:hypothetical protein